MTFEAMINLIKNLCFYNVSIRRKIRFLENINYPRKRWYYVTFIDLWGYKMCCFIIHIDFYQKWLINECSKQNIWPAMAFEVTHQNKKNLVCIILTLIKNALGYIISSTFIYKPILMKIYINANNKKCSIFIFLQSLQVA